MIEAMHKRNITGNISIKLTQLGLDVDKASAIDNLRKILERAEPAGFFVRIDSIKVVTRHPAPLDRPYSPGRPQIITLFLPEQSASTPKNPSYQSPRLT